jgi:hypothetical protein
MVTLLELCHLLKNFLLVQGTVAILVNWIEDNLFHLRLSLAARPNLVHLFRLLFYGRSLDVAAQSRHICPSGRAFVRFLRNLSDRLAFNGDIGVTKTRLSSFRVVARTMT